jgi:protein SCO1/2
MRSLGELKGLVVLVFFGFAQCPDVCPTALGRAAEVRKQLGPDGDKVQVVLITVPSATSPRCCAST